MEISNETWVSCTFSQSGLDSSSDLVKEDYPDLSFVQCISLAIVLNWVYLVILGASRGCTLYEINAYAVGEVIRDSIGGDSRCKTPDRVIGCLHDDSFHPVLHVLSEVGYCSIFKEEHICTESGNFEWQAPPPLTPPLTSCTSPFVQESVGCLYVNKNCWGDVVTHGKVCQFLGGKMFSPNSNAEFEALRNFLSTEHTHPNDQFYAGVEYDEGSNSWVWMYNDRTTESSEWDSPPSATPGCVQISQWTQYKLNLLPPDRYCETKMLLCMADLV